MNITDDVIAHAERLTNRCYTNAVHFMSHYAPASVKADPDAYQAAIEAQAQTMLHAVLTLGSCFVQRHSWEEED